MRCRRSGPGSLAILLCVAAPLVLPARVAAQETRAAGGWGEVFAGSELESYLRVLQVSGLGNPYPWSIRGFSFAEVERIGPADTVHPWAARYDLAGRKEGGRDIGVVAPRVRTTYNAAFPYGWNRGAAWLGRGITTEVSGGFAARYGPLSLTVVPSAFWAQNADFAIRAHPFSDVLPYADPRHPEQIDLPQRFGESSYHRVDAGQTTLRVDAAGLTVGFSNANQVWGPAEEHPLVLGVNAPGFRHGFAGTSRPLDLGIARAHGRLMWGRLEQSEYSPVPTDSAFRFTTGIVGAISPRGVPGLEIGGARFFHMPWPHGGFSRTQLLAPIETFVKEGLLDRDGEELEASVMANQLASIFMRWVFPRSGFEVYAEFASEDHRHNLRDLILQPDHDSAYTLAFRKVWALEDDRLLAVRTELLNAPPSNLHRTRRQEPFYIHASTRQGHTHLGQVLGSPAAYGGAGSTLSLDLYHPGGRATVAWRRTVRGELGEYLETGIEERPDVLNSLGVEVLLFRGRLDVTAGIAGVHNLNRDFEADAISVNAVLGVRAAL
jgi:hypothetical protein